MRKTYKNVIALCAVLIFALALIPVPAKALGDPFTGIAIGVGGASGGGLFGAMAGMSGITVGYSNTTADQADALWNGLNPDHVYFSGEKGQVTEPDPETGTPTVYDYISVDIGDWLQAQNDFIDEFVSKYQVDDNDSGSITVSRSFFGVPFPYQDTNQYYSIPLGINNVGNSVNFHTATLYITNNGQTYDTWTCGQSIGYMGTADRGKMVVVSMAKSGQSTFVWRATANNTSWTGYCDTGITRSGEQSGYSTNWSSGIVNTGVFDGYTAAKVKIPASSWTPSDPTNWNVAEFLEELTVKMVSDHASDIIIEDDQGPVPPPVPIPSTPLGDIPTDEWYDLFGLPVLEGQEEIHQDLQDFSDDVSDGIDDVVGELEDIESDVESIDTNIGIGNGLLGDLKSIGQSIQSTLSSILSSVTDLVQEIVLSTETFIAGLLNSIIGGFGGMFSTMREAFSIWHYVVEWVGSISTVFSWFWSVAGSTSYYIQLPIYASLAGAVVLAFYKRFGK